MEAFLGDVVYVEEGVEELGVFLLEPIHHRDDRGPREVPGHGEEDVVALHPPVPGVDIGEGVGPAVADVLGRVGVGVGHRQVVLGLPRVRVGLEDMCFGPLSSPFLLDLLPVNHVSNYPCWLCGYSSMEGGIKVMCKNSCVPVSAELSQ